jgi:RIO kinase 1
MRHPAPLLNLLDDGVIDEVVRPLKSGKEASIHLVWAGGRLCAAKVYKERTERSFHNRSAYTEGRQARSSRQQRAIDRKTNFGKASLEEAWKEAEVNTLRLLQSHGVRVPEPVAFIEGVLVMHLVEDADGAPAPNLSMLRLTPVEAQNIHGLLMEQVVRMLCAGIIHGDLSAQNVLISVDGPTIIDFPQSFSAAHNLQAQRLLERDIESVTSYLRNQGARLLPGKRYADELWCLYEQGDLTPEHKLTGAILKAAAPARSGKDLLAVIAAELAAAEEFNRRQRPEKRNSGGPRPPKGARRGR